MKPEESLNQKLMRAAEDGDRATVETLLAAGADANACTHGGETALMRAASRGRADTVKLLVRRGADPNLHRQDQWTALMLAAFFGHSETVRSLVACGADVLAADRNGSTALAWASSRGHLEAARILKPSVAAAEADRRVRVAAALALEGRESSEPVSQKASAKAFATNEPALSNEPVRAGEPARADEDAATLALSGTSAKEYVSHAVSSTDLFARERKRDVARGRDDAFKSADEFESVREDESGFAREGFVARENPSASAAVRRSEGSRLRRAALYVAPVLLVVCGALAYRLYQVSGANESGRAAPVNSTDAPAQNVQTQAVPVSPIQSAPDAQQQQTDQNAVVAPVVAPALAPASQPPSYVYEPGGYAQETYAGVPASSSRIPVAPDERPARASGGEPSVVRTGQPAASDERARDAEQTQRPTSDATSREQTPAQRNARRDPARDEALADQPRPAPTPKGKVIPWP